MHELVLHHYEMSPYAEKIRLIFGLKNLAWRSVLIPIVMPKPRLTALTGGYRKTPVLQIGADIYCDTKLIARRLETLQPEPPLFSPEHAALERALTQWSDALFFIVVTIFVGEDSVFDEAFIADRNKLMPGGVNLDLARAVRPSKLGQLRTNLRFLEQQLTETGGFLLGERPGIADLSVYHPLRFLDRADATRALLAECSKVGAWLDRVAASGHGVRTELTAEDAIEIARAATPAPIEANPFAPSDPLAGFAGKPVSVFPEDYGRDPVNGTLVRADTHELAIRRRDEQTGDIVVHFPREDFLCFPIPA